MKCLNADCPVKGGKSCRTPKAPNWKLWQLCYLCAIKYSKTPDTPQAKYYEDKHKHGTGGTWMEPAKCMPMAWIKV
ncbi:hypothetical protein LCGC14_1593420 [marine sediment metagenome]|uniref:Uncharacterized protein n=1 Tax=marine sediment metagenome TaxID=412755 RepID=A0A0F9KU20_9ZZZZ